jgi:hypothetical protein
MCNEFTTTFLVIAKDCLPTKEIIVRENDNPWFNNTLRQEILIRDRIRKKFFFYLLTTIYCNYVPHVD